MPAFWTTISAPIGAFKGLPPSLPPVRAAASGRIESRTKDPAEEITARSFFPSLPHSARPRPTAPNPSGSFFPFEDRVSIFRALSRCRSTFFLPSSKGNESRETMPSCLPCFTSFERCNLDLGHRQVLKGVLLLLLPRPPLRPNDQKHKFPTYSVSRKGAAEKCMHAPDKLPQSDIHSTPLSAFSNDVREGKNSEGARKKRKGKEGRKEGTHLLRQDSIFQTIGPA